MRYSIEGEPLPVVICNLEQGEVMITESGAMSWMSPNMKIDNWWRHRQDVWKSAFGGKHFLKPLHGNEREWDDRVCIVVPGINPGV